MKSLKSHVFVIGCFLVSLSSQARATTLLLGETQTGTISSPAQINPYTFNANGGIVLDFTLVTTSGNLIPKLELKNSAGNLIASKYSGAPFGCGGSTLEMNTVMITATDIYTLNVRDCSGSNTGDYNIYAQSTNDPVGAANLPFGQVQTGTIDMAAQSNTYTFNANANDRVDFTMVTTSGSLVPKIRLYNPDGTLNSSNYSGAPFSCGGSALEMNTVTLAMSGTYTLLVGDCADTNAGTYEIYAQWTNAPAGPAALLFGQVQTGSIGSAAQSNTYTFTANANDHFLFIMATTSGSLVPKIVLYNPGGTLNSSNYSGAPFGCGGSVVELNSVTPVTGTYTMLVRDCSDTGTGDYKIYSQRTNNPSGAATLFFVGTQTGLIGSATQLNTYTFNANTNDRFDFTMVTSSGTLVPKIRLYNPDGTLNSSNYSGAPFGCGGSTVELNSGALSQDGDYTVLVGDCSDRNTGNYNLSSQCFGTCPVAEVSASSLAFGVQTVGVTTASKSVTLSNTGNATISITTIDIEGANQSDFTQSNTCDTSLPVGANCTISAAFTPTAAGPRKSSIRISDSANGSPQTVVLTGVGTVVSPSPSSLDFGSQPVSTSSNPKSVTITNKGTNIIHLWQIAITGANGGDFSKTTTCASTLGAGANCSVSVTFTPHVLGASSALLQISHDGGGSPLSIPLAGTGVGGAAVTRPGLHPAALEHRRKTGVPQ